MGATHVTVTVRNPAEPGRTWEGTIPVRYGSDRLPSSTSVSGRHRPPAQGSAGIRTGQRSRDHARYHDGRHRVHGRDRRWNHHFR